MIKDATSLTLGEILTMLYNGNEEDPILSGKVSASNVMYGVKHFSYNGIKKINEQSSIFHHYTIVINYAKVWEANIFKIRRYEVAIFETAKGLQAKVKVVLPNHQPASKQITA